MAYGDVVETGTKEGTSFSFMNLEKGANLFLNGPFLGFFGPVVWRQPHRWLHHFGQIEVLQPRLWFHGLT